MDNFLLLYPFLGIHHGHLARGTGETVCHHPGIAFMSTIPCIWRTFIKASLVVIFIVLLPPRLIGLVSAVFADNRWWNSDI